MLCKYQAYISKRWYIQLRNKISLCTWLVHKEKGKVVGQMMSSLQKRITDEHIDLGLKTIFQIITKSKKAKLIFTTWFYAFQNQFSKCRVAVF